MSFSFNSHDGSGRFKSVAGHNDISRHDGETLLGGGYCHVGWFAADRGELPHAYILWSRGKAIPAGTTDEDGNIVGGAGAIPRGACVEDILDLCAHRLNAQMATDQASPEVQDALEHVDQALKCLGVESQRNRQYAG